MIRRDAVRQIAYFVPDVREAAKAHSEMYGSGPYFVADNIPLILCRYRGGEGALDHSSAYGQWGELMIEFVQQNNAGPSVFHERGYGMHHVALIVENLEAAMRDYVNAGYPEALYAEVMPGAGFAMMDTTLEYGHFTELYQPSEPLLRVYETVRKASEGFDGRDVIRGFAF